MWNCRPICLSPLVEKMLEYFNTKTGKSAFFKNGIKKSRYVFAIIIADGSGGLRIS